MTLLPKRFSRAIPEETQIGTQIPNQFAKNAAQLKSKKLDLEFSVDPPSEKTCEDFDAGGCTRPTYESS